MPGRYLITVGSVLLPDGSRPGVGSIVELDDDIAADLHARVVRVIGPEAVAPAPAPAPEVEADDVR